MTQIFIFSNNNEIKNLLGYHGSLISDFFLQAVGLISFLFAISIFFTGLNIFLKKKNNNFFKNFFYIILYCLIGCIFFSYYYENSFWLPINGNGGFVRYDTFNKCDKVFNNA